MAQEVEIKLWITSSLPEIRTQIRQLGFVLKKRRLFERNLLLDTARLDLKKKSEMIRLRKAGGKSILTYKGPAKPGPHKSREELECDLEDADTMQLIFERLGYQPGFRYEKYRAEYARSGAQGTITVDETPIGDFLELEGPPRWINKTARELGFSSADYIKQSYGSLYLAWRRAHKTAPADMVFASRERLGAAKKR